MPKNSDDTRYNSGYNCYNDKIAIIKNELVPKKLNDFEEITNPVSVITDKDFLYVDSDNECKKIKVNSVLNASGTQSDWNQTNPMSVEFIKNKPDVANYQQEITALYTIGGIKAGDRFPAGTSLKTIITKMFAFDAGENYSYYLRQVTDKNPADLTSSELINIDNEQDSEGAYINHHFISPNKRDDWLINSLNNQYWYVAIRNTPSNIYSVKKILQSSIAQTLETITVGNYTVYYADTRATASNILLQILFKTADE